MKTTRNELRDACMAALAAATEAGADDVEVSFLGTETEFTRYAGSAFTQVGATYDNVVRVRVLTAGRLGSQSAAATAPESLADTARAAVQVARMSPPLDVPLAFANETDRGDAPMGDFSGELPAALRADAAPGALSRAFADHRSDGVTFAGSLKLYRRRYAVITSGGLERYASRGVVVAQLIGMVDDGSGYAGAYGAADSPVDLAALARTAADKALRGRGPIDLPAGPYDVVLAPEAIAELIEWMAGASFTATSLIDETSLLTGRSGERLCDASITIEQRIDPHEPAFDAEGTTRTPVTFIDRGMAGLPVTDRLSATRLGDHRGSTGHAAAIDDEWVIGPAVNHLRLAPGDRSESELIASVTRGLYITRLHYVNGLIDTRRATTTGMTRDGTFLIEGGELGPAVRNLRFTEHMLEALSRVGGIGRELRKVPTWWSEGGTITVPAVLLRDFQFTGTSR